MYKFWPPVAAKLCILHLSVLYIKFDTSNNLSILPFKIYPSFFIPHQKRGPQKSLLSPCCQNKNIFSKIIFTVTYYMQNYIKWCIIFLFSLHRARDFWIIPRRPQMTHFDPLHSLEKIFWPKCGGNALSFVQCFQKNNNQVSSKKFSRTRLTLKFSIAPYVKCKKPT